MVICEGAEILPDHLPAVVRQGGKTAAAAKSTLPTLDELERTHIKLALDAAEGHRGSAARTLGISERNLYRKLREYNLLS